MRFSVDPAVIRVLTSDGFYLTVEGSGFGRLRCYAEGNRGSASVRWVWGAFREKFLLSNPSESITSVIVEGLGFGSSHRVVVPFEVTARLREPSVIRRRVVLPSLRKPRWHRVSPGNVSARLTAHWHAFLFERT